VQRDTTRQEAQTHLDVVAFPVTSTLLFVGTWTAISTPLCTPLTEPVNTSPNKQSMLKDRPWSPHA
jgi:hypothetical protein